MGGLECRISRVTTLAALRVAGRLLEAQRRQKEKVAAIKAEAAKVRQAGGRTEGLLVDQDTDRDAQ